MRRAPETLTPGASEQDVSKWPTRTLASMVYVYADEHPVAKVREAMEEAAKRLNALPASSAPAETTPTVMQLAEAIWKERCLRGEASRSWESLPLNPSVAASVFEPTKEEYAHTASVVLSALESLRPSPGRSK